MSYLEAEDLYQIYRARRAARLGLPAITPPAAKPSAPKGCDVADCDGRHYAKGLCRPHYGRKHYRQARGIEIPIDELAPSPYEEARYTVTCHTPRCPNQTGGPFRIIGYYDDAYLCARCGLRMTLTPGWPSPVDRWRPSGQGEFLY